mmetsp:Transcript_1371/g.2968  ORF Transcript_1371/g.2968 Transcript_1371/m.2968 type:complete len:483 (+) Transcript_1371:72-1520(+)
MRCASAFGAAVCFAFCVSLASSSSHWNLGATPIQFDTEFADVCHFQADEEGCLRSLGHLFFSGGLEVKANSTQFGGLSSLLVSFDAKRFGSVTDAGMLVTGEFDWHMSWLDGLKNGRIGPILGLDGQELGSRNQPDLPELWDAESMAAYNTTHPLHGDLLVSFERQHRVWRYSFGSEGHRAVPSKVPGLTTQDTDKLSLCPSNGGAEAMELLRDGRIMVLCEHASVAMEARPLADGKPVTQVMGWVVAADGSSQELRYLIRDGLAPVALARIPASDDLLILERKWTQEDGNTIRIRHLTERALLLSLVGGCVVDAGLVAELNSALHNVDNFEGLAVVPGFPRSRRPIFPSRRSEGEDQLVKESDSERLELLIVSDNNFATNQRTLLMSFHVNRTLLPGSTCTAAPPPGWAIGGVAVLVAVPALSVCVCFTAVVFGRKAAAGEKTGTLGALINIFRGDQKFEIIDGDGRPTRRQHDDGTELMP